MAATHREDLVRLLGRAAMHVGQQDSLEGSIRWTWPASGGFNEGEDDADSYEVQAFVRVSNSTGQGGAMVIQATPGGPFDNEPEAPKLLFTINTTLPVPPGARVYIKDGKLEIWDR